MEQRIFHGNVTPKMLAQALLAQFNRGNLRAQIIGDGDALHVQIATNPASPTGGQTAVTVNMQKVSDGVMVSVSEQEWLGVAADVGQTLIAAFQNPWNLLGRLDDIAQNVENMQIRDKAWLVVTKTAQAAGSTAQISERLRRSVCDFCGTGNEISAGSCVACGAPMGNSQPSTCSNCGFVILRNEKSCPNCKKLFV